MRMWKTIRRYNETHDIDLFKTLACDCKEEWHHVINDELHSISIEKHIIDAAYNLSLDDYIFRKLYNLMEGN